MRFLPFLHNKHFQGDVQTVCVGVCNDVWVNATFSDGLSLTSFHNRIDFLKLFYSFSFVQDLCVKRQICRVLFYQHIVAF